MHVVALVGLVSSSVSRLLQSQRAAKRLRAAEAIQQSQATLLRTAFGCVPSLYGTSSPGPGAETSVARQHAK
jgi:type II secretory pathway pseudopilin PulG